MGQYKQKGNGKGSLHLIQLLINDYQKVINEKFLNSIEVDGIEWVSPLKEEAYAEYRDKQFLERVGVNLEVVDKLKDFWSKKGPQWDALGKFDEKGVILVESKANLKELQTPLSFANSPISRKLIKKSLEDVKIYLEADKDANWIGTYNQYLNRLAHLYYQRVLNGVPAYLVMVYFIGD